MQKPRHVLLPTGLAGIAGNHGAPAFSKSRALLGSVNEVERSRVADLQNPDSDRPLAPHWRVSWKYHHYLLGSFLGLSTSPFTFFQPQTSLGFVSTLSFTFFCFNLDFSQKGSTAGNQGHPGCGAQAAREHERSSISESSGGGYAPFQVGCLQTYAANVIC